jgi:ABC-2 type transport system permease protein
VSPIAYAVVAVFLVLNGYSFVMTLVMSSRRLSSTSSSVGNAACALVPLVTMRQFAEERRGNWSFC